MTAAAVQGETTKDADILRSPYADIIVTIRKRAKDTRDELDKISDIKKQKESGFRLTAAQMVDLSKQPEFEKAVRENDELIAQLLAKQKVFEVALVEKSNSEKNGEKMLEDGFTEHIKLIRRILHAQEILQHIGRPIVRKSFEDGEYGAPKLSEDEFAVLDELQKLFVVTTEGCRDNNDFKKRTEEAAAELYQILRDKKDEDKRRTLLNKIIGSDYFENLKQNSASKKEKKDKKKEEKTEEERKKKIDDPNRPKSPPVKFLSSPGTARSRVSSTYFGYDDSLPHPNHFFFHASAPSTMTPPPGLQLAHPMQQLQPQPFIMAPPPHLAHVLQQMQPMQQVNTFLPNGPRESWEVAQAGAGGSGGRKSSPSGSGSVTPNEQRNGRAPMRERNAEYRRPPVINNFNQFGGMMAHHPPFGIPFPNGLPYPPNGFLPMPNQRFPMNTLTNGMGSLGISSGIPMALPNGGLFIAPHTTSIQSNGQPFRGPPPRYSNGNYRARQNGTSPRQ